MSWYGAPLVENVRRPRPRGVSRLLEPAAGQPLATHGREAMPGALQGGAGRWMGQRTGRAREMGRVGRAHAHNHTYTHTHTRARARGARVPAPAHARPPPLVISGGTAGARAAALVLFCSVRPVRTFVCVTHVELTPSQGTRKPGFFRSRIPYSTDLYIQPYSSHTRSRPAPPCVFEQ